MAVEWTITIEGRNEFGDVCRERGIKPRLMRRPNKHHPKLPARLKRFNRLIARQRFAVETTFAT